MMRIALLDLIHTTCGRQVNTIPLGIGLLSVYLKKNIPDGLDIKLFRESKEILKVIEKKEWIPDVVGISQYSWNSQLNLYFARLIKGINPHCLIVVGGPNLEASPKRRVEYLKENNFVDFCVAHDGEIPLLDIITRYLQGEQVIDLKRNPPAGTYCLHPDDFSYFASTLPAPRIPSLDIFGPVYSSGLFDKFLDADFYPIVEATRGCPFTCAFCHASDAYNSKVLFLSADIFQQEMEYLGRYLAEKPDAVLNLTNSNFGLFDEDFKIAKIIHEIQRKYNWPKYIGCSTGKDPHKLWQMLSIVDFAPAIALQTLTPRVLQNISRKNISLEDYMAFQNKVLQKRGDMSATELIMGLSGETKETFLSTLRQVINSGVQNIVIYTLIKLAGTPLATEENANRFQYITRHRVVPRQFSVINNKKILDTEEAIVGTKDMSFADYLELRGLCFTISVFFNSAELIPLKKLLAEIGVDLFEWILNIHKHLKDLPLFYDYYADFMRETQEELFSSREELLKFFEKEEYFTELLQGKRGDNLLRKYSYKIFSENLLSLLDLAVSAAEGLLRPQNNFDTTREMLGDMKKFLATRDLSFLFGQSNNTDMPKLINLKYNVSAWLNNKDDVLRPLGKFAGNFVFDISLTLEQKNLFNRLNSTYHSHNLSWQMIYRDGYTKDLWPLWKLVNSSTSTS